MSTNYKLKLNSLNSAILYKEVKLNIHILRQLLQLDNFSINRVENVKL